MHFTLISTHLKKYYIIYHYVIDVFTCRFLKVWNNIWNMFENIVPRCRRFDMVGRITQNDLLGIALQGLAVRNEVIQNNIANNDTPGFKRKAVDFEDAYARAIANFRRTGELDTSNLAPRIRVVDQNFSFRLDGNNVDIEVEMAELYKNSVRFDTIVNSIMHNQRKNNLVLQGR